LVDFPPFNYVDPKTGNLTGLDRDIITSLSSRLQINTVNFLTFKTFADLDDALVSGKIDLIANNLWIIPRRSELFSFSIPYYLKGGIASMWLKRRGGPFNTTESLTGTRVATLEGGSYIQSFTRNVSPSEIIIVNSSDPLFLF
jgi:ABC-type amino acid transport substrate-binding protein